MSTSMYIFLSLGILFSIFLRFNKDKNKYDDANKAFPYKKYARKYWDDWIIIALGGIAGYFAVPFLWYAIGLLQGKEQIFILPDIQFVAQGYAIVTGFFGSLIFDKLFNKYKGVE